MMTRVGIRSLTLKEVLAYEVRIRVRRHFYAHLKQNLRLVRLPLALTVVQDTQNFPAARQQVMHKTLEALIATLTHELQNCIGAPHSASAQR